MKRSMILCIVPFVACAIPGVASGQTASPAWSGTSVFIKVNTPSSPKYRCSFSIGIVYADGTNDSVSGNTDPPTGGSNLTAWSVALSKTIARAAITRWECAEIS